VSTPLTWDEVTEELDPGLYTMQTVPERAAQVGDPMAPLLDDKPDIARAIERLGQRFTR
jgi:DNA primase